MIWAIFFTNSSGHPDALLEAISEMPDYVTESNQSLF
jgi:hypothetical protein